MAAESGTDQNGRQLYAEDGAALVRDVESFFGRFVILPPSARLPVALWTIGTHLFDVFETFPYLALLSPEKGCGKTRTTKIIGLLAATPKSAVCPSEAALFRLIESKRPTLILDEAEVLTGRGERADAVRAILNAGNCADATVPRCVGQSHKVQDFSVYCPKVVCAIRACPDTVKDRSIVIPMQRKRYDEKVSKFIRRRVRPEAEALRARIVAWCEKNRAEIEETYELLDLDFLSDRDLENFEPLLTIMPVADPCRFEELQKAALSLTAGKKEADEDDSLPLRLLADIRAVWPHNERYILSAELIKRLKSLEESPWSSEADLDQRKLARMLKPYRAESKTVRSRQGRGRGYDREDFGDAFSRYLRPEA
jgi:hypothetical protein